MMTMSANSERIIEKFKCVVLGMYSDEMFSDGMDVDGMVDFCGKELTIRLRASIMGAEAGLVEVSYPATWWDMLRDQLFPEWATRRWPVRMTTERYNVRELFPPCAAPSMIAYRTHADECGASDDERGQG